MLPNVYCPQRGSRQYDATTTAAASDQTLSGLQGGETLTLGGSGTVASANVGSGKCYNAWFFITE